MTFTDRLTLHLGEREIQILNYGRAVTPGDAFLYLPKEKIVVTGDLLVNPVSFALGVYPTGWLNALEKIDGLDATVWVAGHGEPLHDKTLLHATMDVFRELLRQGKELKAKGLDPDQAKEIILPSLKESADQDHEGRSPPERSVRGLPRRLVSAPRLRRTRGAALRRDHAAPAALRAFTRVWWGQGPAKLP